MMYVWYSRKMHEHLAQPRNDLGSWFPKCGKVQCYRDGKVGTLVTMKPEHNTHWDDIELIGKYDYYGLPADADKIDFQK